VDELHVWVREAVLRSIMVWLLGTWLGRGLTENLETE